MDRHPETEILNAFYDKELGAAESGRVETHLKTCLECREALSHWQKIHAAFLTAPEPAVSPEFAYKIMNRLEPAENFSFRDLVRWLVPTGAFMAAAIVFISVVPLSAAETFVLQNEILKGENPFAVQENPAAQTETNADWMGLEAL